MRQQTQKHPNADTPDGKEKIEDAEKNLEITNATLESTKKALSETAQHQQYGASDLEAKERTFAKNYHKMKENEVKETARLTKNLDLLKTMEQDVSYFSNSATVYWEVSRLSF
jgi:hypothetical protein